MPISLLPFRSGMASGLRLIGLVVLLISLYLSVPGAAIVAPIDADAYRSAAVELFVSTDGSFGSLEETYEALRTFQILGLEKGADVSLVTCPLVVENLGSSSSKPKDLFNALRVNSILGCQIDAKTFEDMSSKLQVVVKDATSLLDFHYTVQSMRLIKEQGFSVVLPDADGIFHSIKALSQTDGRWHYDSNSAGSSTYAAGLALEALSGLVSLATDEIDQSMIAIVTNDVEKLFDSIESYDDGALYFDEKHIDSSEDQGPLSTTSSVVRGVTAFAAVAPGGLNIPGDKILGLAKFFLSIGIPGSTKDFFYQTESLFCLENNRVSIPLILSLPANVLSSTSKDQLRVKVTTVFGSSSPPLTVKLVRALSSDSKDLSALKKQELKFDSETSFHSLDILSLGMDVGKYSLIFEIFLDELNDKNIYATGGRTEASIVVMGYVEIDNAEVAVLDTDVESVETKQKLDLSRDNAVSLSANHLQKLRLSFQLRTPLGHAFKPHQVFLKLRHETKVEHIFVLENSGKQFKIVLDFLGLVEKFYYLSGRYDIELTVGDIAMENSFLCSLGHVELDLPEPSEKATRPPPQPVDPYLRSVPKPDISHIFRTPEKRPPKELSLAFLALTLLPLAVFIVGLIRLGVNLKNFPSSALPAAFSVLFHAGIAAVLSLYLLFWLKLDLFTTLKVLGFLGVFLVFVGHRTLSNLASTSAKLKSA